MTKTFTADRYTHINRCAKLFMWRTHVEQYANETTKGNGIDYLFSYFSFAVLFTSVCENKIYVRYTCTYSYV